jgi:hypothetical protein
MEKKQSKEMTLADLIAAAIQVWGSGHAKQMVRLAIDSHWVEVRSRSQFLNYAAKGKTG